VRLGLVAPGYPCSARLKLRGLPQTITDYHRLPQTTKDYHRLPKTTTDYHRLPQTATDWFYSIEHSNLSPDTTTTTTTTTI